MKSISINERHDHLSSFRVRKGVTPYGGRVLPGRWSSENKHHAYLSPNTSTGNSPMQTDERLYYADEVEEVERVGRLWKPVAATKPRLTEFGAKQINTVEDAIDILEGFNIGIGKSSGLRRVPDWEENGRTVTFDEWLTEAHPQRTAALKFLRALAN